MAPFFALVLLLAQSGAAPKQAEILLRRGLVDLEQNRFPSARQHLEQASLLDARNPYIWGALARAYWKLGDRMSASRAAASAENLGAANGDVAHLLAAYFSEAGDVKRAAQFARIHARSGAADAETLAGAASLSLEAGEPREGLPFAEQAAKSDPSSRNRNLLGRIQISSGDASGGIANLAAAWNADPKNAEYCFEYAQALLRRGDFPAAAGALEQGSKSHPGNAQLRLALGVARYGQRRFEDAIDSFLKTIALDPAVEQPYLFLGRMLDQAGPRLDEITARYRAWHAKEPANFRSSLLLAKALAAGGGETAEIEKLLRQSIASNADDWESHYELGLLLVKQRQFPQAAEELARSAALNPREALPHYHLARVYDRLGEAEKAAAERKLHAELTGGK